VQVVLREGQREGGRGEDRFRLQNEATLRKGGRERVGEGGGKGGRRMYLERGPRNEEAKCAPEHANLFDENIGYETCAEGREGGRDGSRERGRERGGTYHAGQSRLLVFDPVRFVDDDVPPLDLLQGRPFLDKRRGGDGRRKPKKTVRGWRC